MNNKILFMILDDQIIYLQGSNIDHREWYISLGRNPDDFEGVIRGFILDNKIVFFKGMNFNYDQEVINKATLFAPKIKKVLQNSNLEVYCGIVINSYGEKWEPVLKINDSELVNDSIDPVKSEEIINRSNTELASGPILELKNNYDDDKFIQSAMRITIGVLILFVIYIVFLLVFKRGSVPRIDYFLWFLEFLLLIFTIYGHKKKITIVKYIGMGASVLLFVMFRPFLIVLGIFYLLFNIDQNYILSIVSFLKKLNFKRK